MMQVDTRATRGRGPAVTDATTGSNAARRSHPEGDAMKDPEGSPANVACRRACGSGACHSRREGTRVGYGHGAGGGCARRARKNGTAKEKTGPGVAATKARYGTDKDRTTGAKPSGKRTPWPDRKAAREPAAERSGRHRISARTQKERRHAQGGAIPGHSHAAGTTTEFRRANATRTDRPSAKERQAARKDRTNPGRQPGGETPPVPGNLSPRKEPSTAVRAELLPRPRSTHEFARRPRTRPKRGPPGRPAPTDSPRA
jgi:hypothetical protein